MLALALMVWPVPAVWALLACLAGRHGRSGSTEGLKLLVAILVAAAVIVFAANGDLGLGLRIAFAGGFLGAALLPTLAFYALGYRIRSARVSGALWFAGTLPLTVYAGVATYAWLALSFCAGWGCTGGTLD